MKKTILLLLTTITTLTVAAQDAPLKFGVNAGATYSGIRGNEQAEKNDYALDALVGISLEIPLNSNFALTTSINYERLSITNFRRFDDIFIPVMPNDPAFMEGGYDLRLTMHYLTIPVNVKYYTGQQKRFYINGGIFAGVFLGESVKLEGNRINDESRSGLFKDFNLGVNLGAGVRFPVDERNTINIELRDNLGLTNISDVPVQNGGTVKTNSLNLILGWQFTL